MLVDFKNGRNISTPITVVWGGPYSDKFFRKYFLKPLHDQLMSPANERDPVSSIKLLDAGLPKDKACASWGNQPAFNIVRVRPHQIAHCPSIGDFLLPLKRPDVINVGGCGWETSVDTENFVVNECNQGQEVEYVCKVLPHVQGSIFPQALIIKTINLSYLSRLMISPEQDDPAFIPYLQC